MTDALEGASPFVQWLTTELEAAQDTYKSGPRSENPRQTDIALGKIRAYKSVRTQYLTQNLPTETDSETTDLFIHKFVCPNCDATARADRTVRCFRCETEMNHAEQLTEITLPETDD